MVTKPCISCGLQQHGRSMGIRGLNAAHRILMHSVHCHARFATLNAFRALQIGYYYCCGRNLAAHYQVHWNGRLHGKKVFVGSSTIFLVVKSQ